MKKTQNNKYRIYYFLIIDKKIKKSSYGYYHQWLKKEDKPKRGDYKIKEKLLYGKLQSIISKVVRIYDVQELRELKLERIS